ncbi:MAG: hypothetical protein IKC19_07095 [Bacteroidales bacterium]|nr:hypothetical protein [Bacteroidales bacterium]
MKTNRLMIAALVAVLAMTACEEKEPLHTEPTPATDVPGISETFSWTEYNWPDALLSYFHANEEEMMQHAGDTIRLAGWIAANNVEEAIDMYHINHFGQMFLTTHPDHTYSYGTGVGICEPTPYSNMEDLCFLDHFDEWWPNLLYVTGIFKPFEVADSMDYIHKGDKRVMVYAIDVSINPS